MTNPNLDPDFSGPPSPNWGLILALIFSAIAWLLFGAVVISSWK